MKTSLMLAFTAILSGGALAQPTTNPPATLPATPAPAPALTTPAEPASAPQVEKRDVPAPKKKTAAATAGQPTEPAVPLVPGPATVNGSNVNLRGQARLNSERIARLNSGDSVTVLEEIILEKPAADEPARWARITLPPAAKVWVNGLFLDATNKTVSARRLNLRAGPGENFSILGLLEQGEQIQEAGVVQGDWIQIEAPTNAYAFVASRYLTQEAPATSVAAAPPAPPPTQSVEAAPVATTVTEPPPVAPPAMPDTNAPAAFAETRPATTGPADAAAIAQAREATRRKLAEIAAQESPAVPEEPLPPRIVSHEGVVRATWSIQAPTKYALVDPGSGRTVNYLYTTSTNLNLSKWKGRRVVITGEEGLDARWRNTPVLTIQKIHVLE